MAGEIAQAFIRIRPNTSGFRHDTESGVERALSSVRVRTRVFAGVTAAATGVAGLGAAFIQGARTSIDFDRGLRNVNSIAHLTDDALGRVGTRLEEISEVSGRGPKELASALYDVVSSGFSARDAVEVLAASSKAASAGLTDAATATRAIDAALNAYHLSADQSTRVSDVLFQVVNKGVLTFEELAQNMGDLVPAAAPLGITLEEVGSAIATITLQGVPAAEAATRVKNVMLQLASPTKQLSALLRQNGFTSGEAAIKSLGYAGVLDLISQATHGSVSETSKLFPEIRAILGVVGVTGKNTATYVNTLKSMGEATKGVGATQRAFAEQAKSVGFQWDQTKSVLAAAAIDIGTLLFPALRGGAEGVQAFAHGFQQAGPPIHDFVSTIGTVKDAVGPVVSGLAGIAKQVAGGVFDATGAGGLLAFAAGFKAIAIATSIAGSARARYASVVATARGATVSAAAIEAAEAETMTVNTAAIVANTAALEANAAASAAATLSRVRFAASSVSTSFASAASNVGLLGTGAAATTTRLGLLGSRLGIVGRGLVALAGGPTGAAAIGLGALGFGIFKLVTRETELEHANGRLRASLESLGIGFERVSGLASELGDAVSSIHTDRVQIQVAKANVALAEQALRTTEAGKGTAAYGSLVANLAQAQDSLRTSLNTLSQDEKRAAGIRKEKLEEEIRNETRRAKAITAAQEVARGASAAHPFSGRDAVGEIAALERRGASTHLVEAATRQATKAAEEFARSLDKDAIDVEKGDPAFRRRLALLADFANETDRIPSQRVINLALKAPNFDSALRVLSRTLGDMDALAIVNGFASGEAWAKAFAAGEKGGGITDLLLSAAKVSGLTAAEAAKAASEKAVATAKDAVEKVGGSITTVDKNMKKASQSVRDAAKELVSANQQLADAIRSGHAAIESAISQADQNLFSIGESLSGTIGEFLDALNKTDKASELTPDSALFKRLRKQIIEGEGGPETRRAAEELAQKIEAAQAKASGGDKLEKKKESTKRQIADLVSEFNKGAISLATFNKRVAAVLAKDGINYKNAGKLLGVAFADGFKAEVQGLKAQAAAIAAGPRRPGRTGLEPTIIKPLEVLKDTQREIAQAQKERDIAARELARDQKHLAALQEKHERLILQEARAHTTQLKLIRAQLRADGKATRAALAKQKRIAPDDRDIGPRRGASAARARAAAEHGYTP